MRIAAITPYDDIAKRDTFFDKIFSNVFAVIIIILYANVTVIITVCFVRVRCRSGN